jgi:hypothetical protein
LDQKKSIDTGRFTVVESRNRLILLEMPQELLNQEAAARGRALPDASRALLVRMVTRRGTMCRRRRLQCTGVFHAAASETLVRMDCGDIDENRAGSADLVQFWPQQRRYRMIEVKGPGDCLQNNQRRLLEYCLGNDPRPHG